MCNFLGCQHQIDVTMLRSIRLALWLLVGPCRALAPLTAVRPAVTMRRSPAVHSALQTDGDQEQQDEIRALRAKLRAAEATIALPEVARPQADPSIVAALVAMGFDVCGARRAALATANRGVEVALSWCVEHPAGARSDDPLD